LTAKGCFGEKKVENNKTAPIIIVIWDRINENTIDIPGKRER
jgi:hypothetical protein